MLLALFSGCTLVNSISFGGRNTTRMLWSHLFYSSPIGRIKSSPSRSPNYQRENPREGFSPSKWDLSSSFSSPCWFFPRLSMWSMAPPIPSRKRRRRRTSFESVQQVMICSAIPICKLNMLLIRNLGLIWDPPTGSDGSVLCRSTIAINLGLEISEGSKIAYNAVFVFKFCYIPNFCCVFIV